MNNCKTILVVEDDPCIGDVLKDVLEMEGYTVSIAVNGIDALNLLKHEHDFSLILLDLSLPDMTGYEFLKKMNKDPSSGEVPVVLCSAASDLKQIELPHGAVSIIPKPFKIEDLFSTVKTFARTSDSIKIGLKINLEKKSSDVNLHHSG